MNRNKFYVKQINSTSLRGYLLFGEDNEKQIPARFNIEEGVYNEILSVLDKSIVELVIDAGKIVGIVSDDETIVSENETPMNITEFIEQFIRENRNVEKNELYSATKNKYPVSTKTIQRRMKDVIRMNNDMLMNQMRVWVAK